MSNGASSTAEYFDLETFAEMLIAKAAVCESHFTEIVLMRDGTVYDYEIRTIIHLSLSSSFRSNWLLRECHPQRGVTFLVNTDRDMKWFNILVILYSWHR